MKPKFLAISIASVILSFAGGFLLANFLNRAELDKLRKGGSTAVSPSQPAAARQEQAGLTDDEIQARLAEADRNPSDISFQKNLGMALFKYAGMRQDGKLLLEVSRLLERVYKSDPKDYESIVALGHSYFDAGLLTENNEVFLRSRPIYTEALKLKPDDTEIRTDLGLTFVLSEPPDYDSALIELEKSIKQDPKHEKTLSALAQVYTGKQEFDKAESAIAKIESLDPNYAQLPELKRRLAAARPTN